MGKVKEEGLTHKVQYTTCTRPVMEVSDEERIFCDCVLKGMTNLDAVFEAGYYPMEGRKDPVVKQRASAKATALLRKRSVRAYLHKNQQVVYLNDDHCDRRALKIHIYDIAMGNISKRVMLKNGDVVELPPSYKDQVSAAALFHKIDLDDRHEKLASVDVTPEDAVFEISSKVDKFISRYSTKKIATNPRVGELGRKGIIDANYSELDDAMDNFIDEETKID